MQEMIAQVAAAVIASLLLLAVGIIAWRTQHHSVDAVQYSASKTQELESLGRTLEEDLANLGSGMTTSRIELASAFIEYDSTAGNYEFRTWTDRDNSVDDPGTSADTDSVRYEVRLQAGEDVLVRNETTREFATVPTYAVTRTTNGASVVYDGVIDAKIRLYRVNGNATTTPTLACEVEVEVRQVSPLAGGTAGMVDGEAGVAPYVDQTRWVRRFRPANLTRAAACRP